MTLSELFNRLDIHNNGELSRSELHESARRMGWHWNEAPVLAVLDLFSILKPITKDTFIAYMTQIIEDPHGPYGKVLLNFHPFIFSNLSKKTIISKETIADNRIMSTSRHKSTSNRRAYPDMFSLLKHVINLECGNQYRNFLKTMKVETLEVSADKAALLIIDPQRSFTKGVWMKSIGTNAELEVKPIQFAFEKCARFLNENYSRIETMFTRCPFPPDSYDWDDVFTGIIDTQQLYFIKPGNSVLFPTTNGFRQWVECLIDGGKNILVIAGCTLNSCVRKSSIASQNYFKDLQLQVVVDLSLSGARSHNFIHSSLYGGLSAVESAVREMINAGVKVAKYVRWT